jgi:cell division protein FtsW
MTTRTLRRYSPGSHRTATQKSISPHNLDGGVIAAISILAGIGLVMIYSITAPFAEGNALPPRFSRHLAALAGGGLILVAALHVPLALWRRLALPLWGLSVLLLILTVLVGVEINGARRWLALPGVRLQPAELVKFATLLAIAAQLASGGKRGTRLKPVMAAGLLCLPPVGLLLLQPDFGSSLVLCASMGALLFASGVSMRLLAAPAILALSGTGIYIALKPYAHLRWTGFLDPWATSSREGFQLVQSYVAFGRGGTFGFGFGSGRQKLHYLPEAHTDFILSGIAEELGLIGVLVVLGAFAAFVWAGTRIARHTEEPFAALVAFAMTALIGLPAAINGAVVMGLLPTTGFTLPFVSYGGNSLLICSLAVGILLRVGAAQAAPEGVRIAGATRRGIARR